MTANYWRHTPAPRILGARRRYWFALAFTIGYTMVATPFAVAWPL